MKHNPGDRVLINDGLLKGKIATITKVISTGYRIDLDGGKYVWGDHMFFEPVEPKNSKSMNTCFKCKDEVLVRDTTQPGSAWAYAVVSHSEGQTMVLAGGIGFNMLYFEVIPYKGNEHLVGTNSDEAPDMGEVSDGYHTFNELYRFRMLYNAAFANMLPAGMALKSRKHSDGEPCFNGDWFIVQIFLPTGQISNHYEMKYWELFSIPEVAKAEPWDGHTSADVIDRLEGFLKSQNRMMSVTPVHTPIEQDEYPHVTSLGDGTYDGIMSGHTFEYKNKMYHCTSGIKGINMPVTVVVDKGKDYLI